jgi:hypothetical protein
MLRLAIFEYDGVTSSDVMNFNGFFPIFLALLDL